MSTEIKTMTALVRRELWENRGFWLVPSVLASVVVFFMIWFGTQVLIHDHAEDVARLNDKMTAKIELGSFLARTDAMATFLAAIAAPFGVMMAFVIFFYLLDSLYGDRRDRSVLFWRSMPITDTQTVLSKLLTATVFGPLCTLAVLLAFFTVWSGLIALFGLAIGFDFWWIGLNPIAWILAVLKLFGVVIGAMLVVAPFLGWTMLASSWAPRAPFLWAALPPLAIVMLEGMFNRTTNFLHVIGNQFAVLVPKLFNVDSMHDVGWQGPGYKVSVGQAFQLSGDYLLEPRLWAGLALAAVFVTGAIWMRRYRDDAAY